MGSKKRDLSDNLKVEMRGKKLERTVCQIFQMNMEQQIKELIVSSNESKQARIKGKEHLTSITTSLNSLLKNLMIWIKTLKLKIKKYQNLRNM